MFTSEEDLQILDYDYLTEKDYDPFRNRFDFIYTHIYCLINIITTLLYIFFFSRFYNLKHNFNIRWFMFTYSRCLISFMEHQLRTCTIKFLSSKWVLFLIYFSVYSIIQIYCISLPYITYVLANVCFILYVHSNWIGLSRNYPLYTVFFVVVFSIYKILTA